MNAINTTVSDNSNDCQVLATCAPTIMTAEPTHEELLLQVHLLREQLMQQTQRAEAEQAALQARYCRLEEEEKALKQQLKVRRACQAHFDNISAFWQENEVSVNNKLVPVPCSVLFATVKQNAKINMEKIIRVESYSSTETSSSGRSRSSSGDQKHQQKTTTTFVDRFRDQVDREEGEDCKKPCQKPCGAGAGVQVAF